MLILEIIGFVFFHHTIHYLTQSFNSPSCNTSKNITFPFISKPTILYLRDTRHVKGLVYFIYVFIYLVKIKTEKEPLSSFTAVIREK